MNLKKYYAEACATVLALLLGISFFVHAAAQSPAAPAEGKRGQEVVASSDALLKAQLETMREYDQKILNTVYWSLGGVFLVVALLAGVNWVSSYRLYERERDTFKAEVQDAVRTQLAEMKQEIAALTSSLSSRVQSQQQEIDEKLDKRLQGVIKKAAASAQEAKEDAIYELNLSEFQNAKFRAKYYEVNGSPYLAFTAWVDFLEVLAKLDWLDAHGGDALTGIRTALQKNVRVSYQYHEKFEALISQFPSTFSAELQKVKKLIEDAPHI